MLTRKQAHEKGYRIDESMPGRPVAYKGSLLCPTDLQSCFNTVEEALVRHLKALVTNPTEDQRDAARHLLANFQQ